MVETVSFTTAKERKGLRVVWFQGLPSPWTQAAKGLFKIRAIDHVTVSPAEDDAPDAFAQWTGQDSYPAAVYDDEKPYTSWLELLFLSERLGQGDSLLPSDPRQRALVIGLSHEIMGEMGFCWSRRLMMFQTILQFTEVGDPTRDYVEALGKKYRYSDAAATAATPRVVSILAMLSAQLADQRALGSPFLLGDKLTALDIYWATASTFLQPLAPEHCDVSDAMRRNYALTEEQLGQPIDQGLITHRDYIYQNYLGLPVEM